VNNLPPMRWYQQDSIGAIYNYFEQFDGNPLICIPTGAGKTRAFCEFIKSVFQYYPGQRILHSTHVKELIDQGVQTMRAVWPDAPIGIYSAGLGQKETTAPITFSGIASIIKNIDIFGKFNILIIDEAHLLGDNADSMYLQLIAALKEKNPKLKVIGYTATGWRTGMGRLTNGPIFTDTVFDICSMDGFTRLFADNHLVRPRPQRVHNIIDTAGISIVNGDFSQSQLAQATTEKITWAALNEALKHGEDRYCRLVFCAGVERANMTAEMLKSFGLRVSSLHSKMPTKDRDDIITDFRNGELDTLVTNNMGTTGFDVPRIDHIIQLRPTQSVGLHVQMIGREMRPYEINGWIKKDALFSDHAGNVRRLGPIDDPFIPKLKVKGGGDAPVKICPACDCYNNASARVCVFCGEIFDIKFNVKNQAFSDEVIRSDLPVYDWFDVSHVYYMIHMKRDAKATDKPVIKAEYYCGKKMFREFIGVEAATGASTSTATFIKRNFHKWWRQRVSDPDLPIPETTIEALSKIDKLIPPKRIEVWTNQKYPTIIQYEY
jgi:DNA repair protein RadD